MANETEPCLVHCEANLMLASLLLPVLTLVKNHRLQNLTVDDSSHQLAECLVYFHAHVQSLHSVITSERAQ